ncbi:Uncharacterised protein [Brevibacterium casei]|nr:Uncharacterised protein [Brevibacterium casei]
MIPTKENSGAGADLSNFYKQSRILTGDAFHVQFY